MALLYNADDIMTAPVIRRSPAAGKLLIVVGIALLFSWAYYFLNLVRPVDAWDFCPLPFAFATLLIGIKLARLDRRILAMIGLTYKRDLAFALAVGTLAEAVLWALTGPDPERAARFIELAKLQEPGVRSGLAIYRHLYAHLGRTGSLWIAEPSVFVVLIAIWSAGAFALLCIVRVIRNASSRVR